MVSLKINCVKRQGNGEKNKKKTTGAKFQEKFVYLSALCAQKSEKINHLHLCCLSNAWTPFSRPTTQLDHYRITIYSPFSATISFEKETSIFYSLYTLLLYWIGSTSFFLLGSIAPSTKLVRHCPRHANLCLSISHSFYISVSYRPTLTILASQFTNPTNILWKI